MFVKIDKCNVRIMKNFFQCAKYGKLQSVIVDNADSPLNRGDE